MNSIDPIAELVRSINANNISLSWVAKWSAENCDPVAAAWAASQDSNAMCALLDKFNIATSPFWRDPPGPPSRPINPKKEPKLAKMRADSLAFRAARIRAELTIPLPTIKDVFEKINIGYQ